jgi:hypothetical protein
MPYDMESLPVSDIEVIDREIGAAIGRALSDTPDNEDVGLIADLNNLRVEMTEPAAFAEIETLLTSF